MTAALLALAVGAAISPSELGVVLLGDDAAASRLVQACPRLLVVPVPPSSAVGADVALLLRGWRDACPGGTVLAQVGGHGATVDSAVAFASWSAWLSQVQALELAAGTVVDGVEGPAEPLGTAADLAAFWSAFADLASGAGHLPVVGALAPGVPAAIASADGGQENAFCATARAMRSRGRVWAWSYHARSAAMRADVSAESTTTLAYRAIRDGCGLAGVPLFVTELGPATRAWSAGDLGWLAWADARLAEDAEVRGAAAYEAGPGADGSVTPFSLAPIAAALAAYLAAPVPDGGTDGGGDGGTDGGVDGGGDGGAGGGVLLPHAGASGPLSPPSPERSGCASAGPALLGAVALPILVLVRRRTRSAGRRDHGAKR